MPTDRASIIDHSVETTHIWLNELAAELGTEDHRHAYRVLRAVLHAVRDRLTVDEAAQLAAQLPELIRGIYYEGWDRAGRRRGITPASRSSTGSRPRRYWPVIRRPPTRPKR